MKDVAHLKDTLQHCHCSVLHNPWVGSLRGKPRQPSSLIAYLRVDGDKNGRDEQLKLINEYCRQHGYEVAKVFEDDGPTPGSALSLALQALNQADGLIAVDLNRFVHNHGDRMRDLKPFIHNFFCHTGRYLLTVTEGIDTSSPAGQKNAVEFFSNVKDLG